MNSQNPWVDVIVPVYRNLEATRQCIESVLAADAEPRARLIVIDDASPEPAVSEYCASLSGHDGVLVLRNEENLGFVATVNRGMQASTEHDVVLLNSDTRVANDWLQRLQRSAYQQPQFGTATPLSNNASVCSYPVPLQENPLPAGWELADLDRAAASANAGQVLEIPTAVGFCMYIKRDCLAQVGVFDVENFGVGYGEECDFCMRARGAGWVNILSPDVFVFHEGGQSFQDTTDDRIFQAEQTLHRIHPQYHVDATRFIDTDPVRPFRDALDQTRLAERPGDAAQIIAALAQLRDRRTDNKSNALLAAEHALGELHTQVGNLQSEIAAVRTEAMDTQQRVNDELHAANDALAQTRDALASQQAALEGITARDERWPRLSGLLRRLDNQFGNAQ